MCLIRFGNAAFAHSFSRFHPILHRLLSLSCSIQFNSHILSATLLVTWWNERKNHFVPIQYVIQRQMRSTFWPILTKCKTCAHFLSLSLSHTHTRIRNGCAKLWITIALEPFWLTWIGANRQDNNGLALARWNAGWHRTRCHSFSISVLCSFEVLHAVTCALYKTLHQDWTMESVRQSESERKKRTTRVEKLSKRDWNTENLTDKINTKA